MTDTPAGMTYGAYLDLHRILGAQHPLSDHHDELLFIIIHQTKELWIKQIIHELKLSQQLIEADSLIEVHKALSRVSRIQTVMTLSWDVLATMTPVDYLTFRHVLGPSSGFQSAQFREMEYLLGLKHEAHLNHQETGSTGHGAMEAALRRPSIWDSANLALIRAGFDLPGYAERGWSRPYSPSREVEAAWAQVYREPERWWGLYALAEKLVDIDDSLATWRHKHVVTVERIIGSRMGTGGTAGVKYLQSTLSKRAFPELWSLRTEL